MGYPTKIATCCFCGARTALKLDSGRHELSCASCGAPLRDLKMLHKEPQTAPQPRKAVSHQPKVRRFPEKAAAAAYKKAKPRKTKKRKSWFKDVAEDLFDIVEDIFD